jgi:hypothetical protein
MRFKTGLNNPRPMTHLASWSSLKMKYAPRAAAAQITIDYTSKMPTQVGMMGNDMLGDCFWATQYHRRQLRTLFATGTLVTEPDSIVIGAYSAGAGYVAGQPGTDQGTDAALGYDWIMKNGLPTADGTPIQMLGAIEVDFRNPDDVLDALDFCGGLDVGITLPQRFVQGEAPDLWDWLPTDVLSEDGHEILLGRAEPGLASCGVITWGETQKYSMTKAFWDNCVNQTTATVTADWIEQTGKTPFGMTLQQLLAEMQAHSGGPIP